MVSLTLDELSRTEKVIKSLKYKYIVEGNKIINFFTEYNILIRSNKLYDYK